MTPLEPPDDTTQPGDGTIRFSTEPGFLIIEAGEDDTYTRVAILDGVATINFNDGTITYGTATRATNN